MDVMGLIRHKILALVLIFQAAVVLPAMAVPTMWCADGSPCGNDHHTTHACCQVEKKPVASCHEPVNMPRCEVRPGQAVDVLARGDAPAPAKTLVPVAWINPQRDVLVPAAPTQTAQHPELIYLVFDLAREVHAPRGPPAV